MKRITSLLLSLAMTFGLSTVAIAAEDNEIYYNITASGEGVTDGVSDLSLEVVEFEPNSYLVATVPVELPIVVDTAGNVTVPTEAKIINNTDDKTLEITKVNVTLSDMPIAAAGKMEECSKAWASQKFLTFKINNDPTAKGASKASGFSVPVMSSDFVLTSGNWDVAPKGELPITLEVEVPPAVYNTVTAKQVIGTISFTLAASEG